MTQSMNSTDNPDQPLRIMIADDHQMFTEGLVSLLMDEAWIEIVGTASNGQELLNALPECDPHLVLMDINMPELDGIEATKIVVRDHPEVKVLMLTMINDATLIRQLIELGTHGYILKNTGKTELLEAIRTLGQGKTFYSKEVTQEFMDSMRKSDKKTTGSSFTPEIKITKREREVLKLIALEMTAAEIAEKLFISQNTVVTHRKNLISKLNVRNSSGLAKYALRHGLVD